MPDQGQQIQTLFSEVLTALRDATRASDALRAMLEGHATREEEVGNRIEAAQRDAVAGVSDLGSKIEALTAELRLHRERDEQEATREMSREQIRQAAIDRRWTQAQRLATVFMPLAIGVLAARGCIDTTAIPITADDPAEADDAQAAADSSPR